MIAPRSCRIALPRPARRLALTIITVALLLSAGVVLADDYAHDDGVFVGGRLTPGDSFANAFTISAVSNQTLQDIRIKQPSNAWDPSYTTGTADLYIWDDNGAGGTPGTVLGKVEGVTVPSGDAWTIVDFSVQNIALSSGSTVFVGFVNPSSDHVWALYDELGGTYSFRKPSGGVWDQDDSGDLMVRMTTTVPYNPNPSAPTSVIITPPNATLGDKLIATASGSTPADPPPPGTLVYQYDWRTRDKLTDPWSGWVFLDKRAIKPEKLKPGAQWQVRARAVMGVYFSDYTRSDPVTIQTMIGSMRPRHKSTGADRCGAITLTFRWPMVAATVPARVLVQTQDGTPIAGTKTWIVRGAKLEFKPAAPLPPNTQINCLIQAGVTRVDGGVVRQDVTRYFTTSDRMAVVSAAPTGDTVARNAAIVVECDRPIDPATVTDETFTISPAVAGRRVVSNRRITFTPSALLPYGTTYTVSCLSGIRDTGGRRLEAYGWSFTTRTATAATASAPVLNVAATAAPTNGALTQVTVNLSAAAEVQAQVTNISGRVVANLPPQALPAGLSTLLWDGKSALGTKVPAGVYLMQVKAFGSEGGSAQTMVRFRR